MPLVPDYASATGPRIARGLYGWVLFCAIAPMVTGVGILVLYMITRRNALPLAGFFFLGIGFVIVLIGLGLLVWYQSQQKRANLIEPAVLRKRVRLALVLLVANVLIAIGCAVVGVREMDRQIFVVQNTGTSPIQNLVIILPDKQQLDFGTLVPRQTKRRSVISDGEGSATLKASVNGQVIQQEFGYFTSGKAQTSTITINGTTVTVK